MNIDTLLSMLKVDLGFSADAYDDRLKQYISGAINEIRREGAVLDKDSIEDMNLVIMYAAWKWRNRDNMNAMPRMLRYALNCRIMSEKARRSDAS